MMKKQSNKVAIVFLATTLATLASCGTQTTENSSNTVSTADQIMAWWPGDYNNDNQIANLEAEGSPVWRADDSGKGGHIEVTSHYRAVELPAFGTHVLYVEETKHNDPNNMFRQRIYTINEDTKAGTVRVKLWYFNDKEKYVGAWKDLDLIADLTPEDMFPLQDSCDLIVSRQGDKYHMPMLDKACVFGKSYFNYQVLLGSDSFWFRDKINSVETDEILSTAGDFTYHELDKID